MRKYPKLGNTKYRTLDKWFSVFIRLRDSDANGQTICITCQKVTQFDRVDAGHFMTRNNISTRFNEKNVHGQCRNCNSFKGGESIAHGIRIVERYGQSELDLLVFKSKSMMKLMPFEVKEMSKEYRIKARALFAEKSDWFKEMYKNIVR